MLLNLACEAGWWKEGDRIMRFFHTFDCPAETCMWWPCDVTQNQRPVCFSCITALPGLLSLIKNGTQILGVAKRKREESGQNYCGCWKVAFSEQMWGELREKCIKAPVFNIHVCTHCTCMCVSITEAIGTRAIRRRNAQGSLTHPQSCFYFFLIFILYWSIADVQRCVRFRGTAEWFSYTYTYIYCFSDSFPI